MKALNRNENKHRNGQTFIFVLGQRPFWSRTETPRHLLIVEDVIDLLGFVYDAYTSAKQPASSPDQQLADIAASVKDISSKVNAITKQLDQILDALRQMEQDCWQ